MLATNLSTLSENSNTQNNQRSPLMIDRQIGLGKFAVYHAFVPHTLAEYAVKIFPQQDKLSRQLFSLEKKFLQHLTHPNIIRLISESHISIRNVLYNTLVMEYAPYGDLHNFLKDVIITDVCLIRGLFHQLIAGVEYLHSQQIAHFDLKLENILIGRSLTLKLTDFDQSCVYSSWFKQFFMGTTGFRAPEVIERCCSNIFAADVYSLGVILYVIINRSLPFLEEKNGDNVKLCNYNTFNEDPKAFWSSKALETQQALMFNDDLQELLSGMFEREVEGRWTIEQIKKSKWYNGPTYSEKEQKAVMMELLVGRFSMKAESAKFQ